MRSPLFVPGPVDLQQDMEISTKVLQTDDMAQHHEKIVDNVPVPDPGNDEVTSNPNGASSDEKSQTAITHESPPSAAHEATKNKLEDREESQHAVVQSDSKDEGEHERSDRQEERQATGKEKENENLNERQTTHKSAADLIETLILKRAGYKPAPDVTEAERADKRRRVLGDPKTRHRLIFMCWPHVLVAKPDMVPVDYLPGKMAPNGIQLWGASLLHFYHVQETVQRATWATEPRLKTTTASKMLKWVTLVDDEQEHESTKCWVDLAKREEDPEIIEPCNIAQLITAGEAMQRDTILRMRGDGKDGDAAVVDQDLFPRTYPIESVFTADTYPTGWIREPFSQSHKFYVTQPGALQQYIPQHLLLQKLTVHDRCNLLHVSGIRERQATDITHTYKLQPSKLYSQRREADQIAMIEQEVKANTLRNTFLADPHTRNAAPPGYCFPPPFSGGNAQPGLIKPFIFLILPPIPPRITAQEGHLHIDKGHFIGEGHHSYVYFAELELPRNILVPLQICKKCIDQDLSEQLQTIYQPDGSSIDPTFNEETGRLIAKKSSTEPVIYSPDDSESRYVLDEGKLDLGLVYEGPLRVLHSRVRYHNPEEGPYCEHRRKTAIHPLTAKVHVAAKLSFRDDDHLAKEADNYQRFPKHFFEHWSGYNVVPPMNEPVPIEPIVPQFYGYYVLNEEAEYESSIAAPRPYLSPILLLERCGQPIEPETLSADEKNQCASLIHRFHDAKWAHGSIYKRNILQQKGPLSKWPMERKTSCFRLIDFGRSVYTPNIGHKSDEDPTMDDLYTISGWLSGRRDLN